MLGLFGAAEATASPSGLEVWLTCRHDIGAVCPHTGIFHLQAMKNCMRQNFDQLGERCQTVVRRYQEGRRQVASGDGGANLSVAAETSAPDQ